MALPMKENPLDRFMRMAFNFLPSRWVSGGSMRFISKDHLFCRVWIKKTWLTTTRSGEISIGNMYSGVSDAALFLLNKRLAHHDVEATMQSVQICYLRPATVTVLIADIHLDEEQLSDALANVTREGKGGIHLVFSLRCPKSDIYAEIEQVIHIKGKTP